MFEVEKKFKIPPDFTAVLLEQGWKYLEEIHLKDTYFDTEAYELVRNDHWLRQRGTKWQLKCPTTQKPSTFIRIDRYEEIETEKNIFERVRIVLNVAANILFDEKTNNVAQVFGLKPIAEVESFRTKYRLGSFTIDLDRTNFDYELGEIELMCETEDEMPEATAKIFDMAGKLGELNDLEKRVGHNSTQYSKPR